MDVAPIVYLDEGRAARRCAEALVLADALGREGLPVYLYGALAGGRTRAELRRGGPEALISAEQARLRAARLHPTAGAVLVSAREPLVAFNVELAPAADAQGRPRDRRADPRGRAGGAAGRARDRGAARACRAGVHQRRGSSRRDARRRGRRGAPARAGGGRGAGRARARSRARGLPGRPPPSRPLRGRATIEERLEVGTLERGRLVALLPRATADRGGGDDGGGRAGS